MSTRDMEPIPKRFYVAQVCTTTMYNINVANSVAHKIGIWEVLL